jgi:hypothetical protein
MAGKHPTGWKRIGGDVLRALQTLMSVEDAPAAPTETQHPMSMPVINPTTGLRMLGGVGGVDTSGCTFGQSTTMIRTQKR